VCGCSAMETHFMKLSANSSYADVASRGSLELSSECCNRGQMIFTCFSTRRSCPVSLCSPPLFGKVASYDGATLKLTELFSKACVCLWRLHDCVLNFIHLLATGVAEIAKSTNLSTYIWIYTVCFFIYFV
jgi:hypothetical protein